MHAKSNHCMTVMAASAANILSAAPEVGSWAEAVEQDSE
ncbi:hypothetical protein OESDEN_22845 [Oesophagostomum dentatum]|uniref:Uncharacterized protein n=1 Tax=Oesophagostomum dentatum TaxID=61180 RepID=A0A0B1S2T0_OESDE|nr:hypothetical protein OESDEN_22845 [Oesophagostomum dentatum]